MTTTIQRSGTQDNSPRPYEIEHSALARQIATEGIVLLKNEGNVLPLKENSEVALFGAGALKTVKGGTGSGNVYARRTVNVLEGLEEAGFQITNRSWLEGYSSLYDAAREAWKKDLAGLMIAGIPAGMDFSALTTRRQILDEARPQYELGHRYSEYSYALHNMSPTVNECMKICYLPGNDDVT